MATMEDVYDSGVGEELYEWNESDDESDHMDAEFSLGQQNERVPILRGQFLDGYTFAMIGSGLDAWELWYEEMYGQQVKLGQRNRFPEDMRFDYVLIDNTTRLIRRMERLIKQAYGSLKSGCHLEIVDYLPEKFTNHKKDPVQLLFDDIRTKVYGLGRPIDVQDYQQSMEAAGFQETRRLFNEPSDANFIARRLEGIYKEVTDRRWLDIETAIRCFEARKYLTDMATTWSVTHNITWGRKL